MFSKIQRNHAMELTMHSTVHLDNVQMMNEYYSAISGNVNGFT